ncbi:MAG: hypothetical protein DRI91_05935 [Aquificota bacterium]|nr:MAG: hypothetical protein DRI91_05935 [Aquificota bacterium]
MKEGKGGFRYYVSPQRLEEYGKWPLERRLAWLFFANKMRRSYPKEVLEIQDAFRRGDIEPTR